jgi:hypothetical protein
MKTLMFFSLLVMPAFAGVVHEVELGQKITVKSGEGVKLKGQDYSVTVGAPHEPVACAVPGFNCGSGYIPPAPTFQENCTASPCPYFFATEVKDASTANLTIHNEKSCEQLKAQASACFYSYARTLKSAEGCSTLKGALGKYHCLQVYSVALPQFRSVCDELPSDIQGLRENCYYDWAIRYRDASYCKKFDAKDFSGAERCWLKMAELLNDRSLCRNIKKEPSYVAQCQALK